MTSVVKEEPVEFDEKEETNCSLIDQKYESELVYLKNVSENILANQELDLENFELDEPSELLSNTQNSLSVTDILNKMTNTKAIKTKMKKFESTRDKIDLEKKNILTSLINSTKTNSTIDYNLNKFELMNVDEEAYYLKILNKQLDNEYRSDPVLARFRAKLTMRNLKRKNFTKIFDIDSFTNELIDQEKIKMLNLLRQKKIKSDLEENSQNEISNCDDDIIFESASLQTTDDSEIIEIKRVLDRFNNKKIKSFHHQLDLNVHMVDARKEDVKCLISPYSNQVLKPFIWRDGRSLPKKLKLHKNLLEKLSSRFDRDSIDYVHLRPEHVIPINAMCRQHFWTGIDISECLEYPDYTIVALYRKLIVGFALLVPNCSLREAYLSFILVHPDWRSNRDVNNDYDVSIAKFLLYYLIQVGFLLFSLSRILKFYFELRNVPIVI